MSMDLIRLEREKPIREKPMIQEKEDRIIGRKSWKR